MKKILIPLLLISSFANAIENLNDIKPHSYGRNNLTLNVLPGTISSNIESNQGSVSLSPLKGYGFGIHSKASIKEYHYKKSEFFWAGGVDFKIYKSNILNQNTSIEFQDISGNVEFGYSTHINKLLMSSSIGGVYSYAGFSQNSSNSSFSSISEYGEVSVGYDFDKWILGGIYNISNNSLNTGYKGYLKPLNIIRHTLSIPIQKNLDRNTAIIFKPSFSYGKDNSFIEKEAKFTIGFSWLYGL